jgi:hypothetical protein
MMHGCVSGEKSMHFGGKRGKKGIVTQWTKLDP